MAEVAFSSEDITVLGGPSRITVEVDVGPKGSRGTFVMYGLLNPNEAPASAFIDTPIIFDLYVVIDPSSEDYLQMFQYLNQDGQLLWVPVFKLSTNVYSTNRVLTFNELGVAELNINLFELGLTNVADIVFAGSGRLFSVQLTLTNIDLSDPFGSLSLPAAHSVVTGDVYQDEVDDLIYLPITVTAAEVDPIAGWQAITDKSIIGNIFVTVVDPSYVLEFFQGEES